MSTDRHQSRTAPLECSGRAMVPPDPSRRRRRGRGWKNRRSDSRRAVHVSHWSRSPQARDEYRKRQRRDPWRLHSAVCDCAARQRGRASNVPPGRSGDDRLVQHLGFGGQVLVAANELRQPVAASGEPHRELVDRGRSAAGRLARRRAPCRLRSIADAARQTMPAARREAARVRVRSFVE